MKEYVKPELQFVALITEERLAATSGGCQARTWNNGQSCAIPNHTQRV